MRDWIIKPLPCLVCAALAFLAAYYLLHEKKESDEIVLFGNVDVRLVDIGFRVAGRVDQLFFEEGDKVQEGQLIALLEKTPYDAQRNQAAANLDVVTAALKNAEI